jgi:parallel beta-helix repeat protein
MKRFLRVLVAIIGISAVLTAVVSLAAPLLTPLLPGGTTSTSGGSSVTVDGDRYPGDPDAEAGLVEKEQARVVAARSAAASAAGAGVDTEAPFRVLTEPIATLILPARELPYTMSELAEAAPDSVSAADGAFLVTEHLLVMEGATISIDSGETVRLASSAKGFTSIVALGGVLQASGSEDAPATITSWDAAAGGPDEDTSDGRAYVRVNEGAATLNWSELSALGFWSGPTGGFSLVGSDFNEVLPEEAVPGEDGTLAIPLADPAGSGTVTGELSHVTISGNAYGLFLTKAAEVTISDASVTDSLVDGILLDRDVRDSKITATTVADSGVDGISVAHAGENLVFDDVAATGNGRNGITLDGTPVADGPNASGEAVEQPSGRSITGTSVADNGRYGIDIRGGADVAISDTKVSGGQMGIVISHSAQDVQLTGVRVSGTSRHAIAIRDRSSDIEVLRSTVAGGEVGIYARSSRVAITDNEISDSRERGITLVGSMNGSRVFGNDVSGSGTGSSAIDSTRAFDVRVEDNLVDGWATSRSLEQILLTVFQPLTVLWATLLAVVALAVFWRLGKGPRGVPDPERAPLQSMSRGVVDRAQAIRMQS